MVLSSFGRRSSSAVEAAALAVGAWVFYTRFDTPIHIDTARDLLLARDCADGIECHFAGPTTSFGGLAQGATWIHVLEAARSMHAGPTTIAAFVWGLFAVSIGVFHVSLARERVPRGAAVLASLAYAVTMPRLLGFPTLWNPSLLALPAVLFFVALRACAQRYTPGRLAAATVALAALVDLHLIAVLLFLPLAAVALAAPPRSRRFAHLVAFAGLGSALLWLSSHHAMAQDAARIAQHPAALGFAALGFVLTAAALARRWREATPDRITWDASAAYAVLLIGGSLASAQPLSGRYWAPIAPTLALLLARALAHSGRWPRVVAGLALVWLVSAEAVELLRERPAPGMSWTLAAAERCATTLASRGWTARGAVRSLDAPGGRTFVSTVTPSLPLGQADDAPSRLLVELRGGTCVDVPPIVDVVRALRCVDEVCGLLVAHERDPSRKRDDFAGLSYPERWQRVPASRGGDDRVSYVLPLTNTTDPPPFVVRGDARTRWGRETARWDVTRRTDALVVSLRSREEGNDDAWPPVVLPASSE